MSSKNNQDKEITKINEDNKHLQSTNKIQTDENSRIKRIFPDILNKQENYFKKNDSANNFLLNVSKEKMILNINEEEKGDNDNLKSNIIINSYEIFKEINENNKFLFREKYEELKNILYQEFQNYECKEFYLISRNWFLKLIDFLKTLSIELITDLMGKMDNNELLLEREIIDNALFLTDEKKKINIIKPKFVFFNKKKPAFANHQLWEFIHQVFGGGPEIKILAEKSE